MRPNKKRAHLESQRVNVSTKTRFSLSQSTKEFIVCAVIVAALFLLPVLLAYGFRLGVIPIWH